ncbi:2-amino-4-hydroxy-6-hydroxymethyldihydropteridine pyrophosphokinase [Anaplasma platys]|uniref:2-amino-4-hydroxy-6-hydroxymethyldihydropteridine pyrophosphokinase n=1 Tax=Anaplasma platys TaxID=949 RepID=A0A858PXJ4_9RICK|nr:2-amino-4-hydroxy-6-hydroxymethyldihydropteridine diphosphokinase [Anaplasma platys]QJC27305.1 2-amino-4-hydroxy-6-hydroxymethyldihydropteridine pyrophosphokinase [Anaplasma platys]
MLVLALGSNVGDRMANLKAAVKLLPIHNIVCSAVYESRALLPPNAPICWDAPFLNMSIAGYTHLSPMNLLEHTKEIEHALGRYGEYKVWSPRTIDIDIALWEGINMSSEALSIPHAELHKRAFVLVPICDICPRFPHTVLKSSIEDILVSTCTTDLVKKHNALM